MTRNTTSVSNPNNSNTDGFEEFTIDSSHPFYVHPSDSLGSQLVTMPFNGIGFVHWRSSMVTSLSAKNKLGIVTGKIKKPKVDSPLYSFWERCNDMVKAWITNSLTREITSNGSKYIYIQREVSSTTQGTSDIASYFTKLRRLWDELSSAYVGPTCTCGALPKFIEDQHLLQFLSGLNDNYSTVKSTILMLSPLPSMSKAYSLLQQDESQKETRPCSSSFSGESSSFSASASQNSGRTYNQRVQFDPKYPNNTNQRMQFDPKHHKNSSLFSKYCKSSGHVVEKCHRLHGYPPDFKFTKNNKLASCVQTEANISEFLNNTGKASGSPGYSKEQVQHLIAHF
ncbi:uncharacterized protein LOC132608047 [Lycium barbarum]|uniref:uncharacterized protein LOC132608047 n=1 Tax=Lycium barbarum TaxID=112863 RepID=UPI00293E689A|nr:uncharacterized protein LOC132608047 [Lycium barbarum]